MLLFPSVRLYGPFRHYVIGFVFLALFALQLSRLIEPTAPVLKTDDPRLADTVAYEDLLYQKAKQVLDRYGATQYSIDLSVTLDHTTVTTTTFDPGTSCSATTGELLEGYKRHPQATPNSSGGTWQEEVNTSPRVRTIKVCVAHNLKGSTNQQELQRSLSYALGIDTTRGDILRVVSL